jgi:hypothetical protein
MRSTCVNIYIHNQAFKRWQSLNEKLECGYMDLVPHFERRPNHGLLHSLKDYPMVKDIVLLDTWSMKLDMFRIIWELNCIHLLNKETHPTQQSLGKNKRSMSIGFYKWKFQATNLEWYFRRQIKFGTKDNLFRPKFGACAM